MEVHHHSHKPKNWKEYITEFIMLFAAVTLGFLAENLREHQIMEHRVEQNKIAILKDLQADSATIVPTDSVSSDSSAVSGDALTASDEEKPEETSLWGFFLLALGGGFVALLTPCVYPLIPMTVSYFTKQKGGQVLDVTQEELEMLRQQGYQFEIM